MTNTSPRGKAIALLILVFVLGAALGVVGTVLLNGRVYGALQHSPPPPTLNSPTRSLARLNQALSLSQEQQTQLLVIISQMQSGYDSIRQSWQPQIDQVREAGRNQIRQLLTPDQLPKFEDYLRKVDEDRAKRNTRQ